MDTKESPLEYIIVYNGGAYGNFVGWCLEWLTGKVSLENRPWGLNGNSHKNKLICYQSVESACSLRKTGIVHPIFDSETSLIDSLNEMQKNFNKVIFLYPQLENFVWNMNNRFNPTPKQLRTREVMDKIIEIKAWFSKTDYYVNKIIRGEWNEQNPKWVAYKQEAKIKSVELEKLQVELKELKK
jgi:hypothetical protein